MLKVYGITNCDTVKKALTWLKDHQLGFVFHDFKKLGISDDKLDEWSSKIGWEALLNKRGTTWKKIPPEEQALINSKQTAFQLMKAKSSIIKRPIIEFEGNILLGFDEKQYEEILL